MKNHQTTLEWTNEPTIVYYILIYHFFSQHNENIKKKGDFHKPPNSKNGISFYIILFTNMILFNNFASNFISQYKLSQKLSI